MSKQSISFLHLSDTHFGVHYAIKPKNLIRRAYGDTFFQKAHDVIQNAITKHQIDFIIHSGDFFNRSKPPPAVVDRAVKPFVYAANHGVPVYLLPGNHERSKLPIGLLSYYKNINLFIKPSTFCFEKQGTRILLTGFPYIRHNAPEQFEEILRQAWDSTICKDPNFYHYSILVTHQLIEGSCIENYVFRRGKNIILFQQIPNIFNYIACGHVHRFQFLIRSNGKDIEDSIIQSTNKHYSIHQNVSKKVWGFLEHPQLLTSHFYDPIIAYPGSLERVSMIERYEPKGYIIGKLYFSEHDTSIQAAEYTFHPINAIKMCYYVWDLNTTPVMDHIDRTLESLYSISSSNPSMANCQENSITAIIRIKIIGSCDISAKQLDFLKQEAKRHKIYIMFSFPRRYGE